MTSGTQSPPLEATGEHKPMGISSVDKPDAKVEVVPDSEQRAGASLLSQSSGPRLDLLTEYFKEPTTAEQKRAAAHHKVRHHHLHLSISP